MGWAQQGQHVTVDSDVSRNTAFFTNGRRTRYGRNLTSRGPASTGSPCVSSLGSTLGKGGTTAFGVPRTWAGSRPVTHWLCKPGPVARGKGRDACLAGLSRDSVSRHVQSARPAPAASCVPGARSPAGRSM